MYPRPLLPHLRRLAVRAVTVATTSSTTTTVTAAGASSHRPLAGTGFLQSARRSFAAAAATAGGGKGAGGSASSKPPPTVPPQSPPPPPAAAPASGAGAGTGKPPAPPADASVVELTDHNLEAVIARSPVPVILDCYADWCEPCKKLTPVLETMVKKYQGRLILAKLNADKYQEVAMSLNVRSLPAVFGIHQGKLVDRFVGMPSDQVLASFLERLLSLTPGGAAPTQQPDAPANAEGPEVVLAEADALAAQEGKAAEAGALYKKVYEELSKEETPPAYLQARCLAGLAKCALASGHAGEAGQIVAMLRKQHEAEIKTISEVASAVSFLETALKAPQGEGEEGAGGGAQAALETLRKLEERVKADPADLEARHALALKCFQLQKFQQAMDGALEILKRDKTWNDGAARTLLIQIFEAVGPSDPELVKKGRARMTNYLYL